MRPRRHATLDWFSERLNITEFLSILSSFGLIYVELDNRKPPRAALAEALARPVASYARWPRVLGLSVVVLVAVQILTGSLLALYYLPTPAAAHESVELILRDVRFGRLVHQVHFWGAQLLILALFARALRYLSQGIYRTPRELEWVFSLGLLMGAVVADASGRLLLWSSDAYWFGVRALEVLGEVPLVGAAVGFLFGGEDTYLSSHTLIRTYGLHVAIAPICLVLLVFLHFSTVRRLGLNECEGESKTSGTPLLHRHLLEVAMVLVFVITVLVTLAVLAPQLLPCAADPYATLPSIQVPWYLLAPAGLADLLDGRLSPATIGGVMLALSVAVLLLPFVDRSRSRGRLVRLWAAAGLLLAWLLLTLHGARLGG